MFILSILFILLYFLPTFLVKTDKLLMLVLNLFLGWTIIGWFLLFFVAVGSVGHHG